MTIDIVLADDHALVRAGLRMLISRMPDCQIVGEADNGYAALKLVEQLRPAVLVTDLVMPGPSGIELAASIRSRAPETRVLLISVHEEPDVVWQAMQSGAAGYLTKRAVEEELERAVRVVASGATYLAPGLRMLGPAPPGTDSGRPALEQGELLVLRLAAQGQTDAEIAQALQSCPDVVKCQREAVMKKLAADCQADLVRSAHRFGLLH